MKLLFILIFLLCSCVKKDVEKVEKKETLGVEVEQAIEPSPVAKEKCDARCRAVKPLCISLKKEWSACKDFKTKNLCSGFLKSFIKVNQVSFDCNETSCEKTEFGNGSLGLCADIEEENFKTLFVDSVKLLAELDFSEAQKMYFSSYFESAVRDFGLEKIVQRLEKIKKKHKRSIGFVVHIESENDNEAWLKGEDLNCLPKDIQKYVAKGENSTKVVRPYDSSKPDGPTLESVSVDLGLRAKRVVKSCKISKWQVFDGKTLKPFKFEKMTYIVSEKDDCLYSTPRLAVRPLKVKTEEYGFAVLSNEYRVLPETDSRYVEFKSWSENKNSETVYSPFAHTLYEDFSGMVEHKKSKRAYAFVGTIGMASIFEIYQYTKYGPILVTTLSEEPCGS